MNRTLLRVLKRFAIGVCAVLGLGVLGLGLLIAWEWTYIDRLRHHPVNEITEVSWYVPKEPVAGGGGEHLPRAQPNEIRIVAEALDVAAEYAESKKSSAIVVVHDDRVVFERHWRGHKPEDSTNSASMAKTVTALLIGIAVDEGLIRSLDEPASTWLPTWHKDDRARITVRHLLQMHSGLEPEGQYEEPFSNASYLALGTDLRYVVDNIPARSEPGKQFDYSSVNFQALGFILEAATGKRYAEYLSEKLWKPLGAGDAALWLDKTGGSSRTYGYLFATAEDWAKVGLLFLHEGDWKGRRIVSRKFIHEMITPSPSEPKYGIGIWLAHNPYQIEQEEEEFLMDGIFYLDGRGKQRVYVVPGRSLVVVRVGENARGWDEAALVNAVLRGLQAP
jgi:CubicO group peptidase (beta-lactamase class C family)